MTVVATRELTEIYGTDIDLFSRESLADPAADYHQLQDIGPLAYMRRYDLWAATRYSAVQRILTNPDVFCSSQGIGMNETLNTAWKDFAPTQDGAAHAPLRQVMMQTIGPRSVQAMQPNIEKIARDLVEDVVSKRRFDAVVDFAQMMPMLSVVELLGLSPDIETRRELLHWATDTYNVCGPDGTFDNELPSMQKLYEFAIANLTRDKVRPGSIGDLTFKAVDAGQIEETQAIGIIGGYFTAGLDTTAAAIGNMMMLLTKNPDQWEILKANPNLVGSTYNEAVRIEAPAQWFTRVTTRPVEFDDIHLPAGTRILHSYGAANLDERHYPDADRFDVRRNPTDHLAFGQGPHMCMGKWLSNLEVNSLMGEFVRRVDTLRPAGEPVRHINNLIRSLDSLPVEISLRSH